jgi:uncharacterized surface protein with fasciclin (FAS1) repeats
VTGVLVSVMEGALSGAGLFTVFAPTNDGFNKTLGELGLSAEDVLGNQALLTDILLYHAAAGAMDAQACSVWVRSRYSTATPRPPR